MPLARSPRSGSTYMVVLHALRRTGIFFRIVSAKQYYLPLQDLITHSLHRRRDRFEPASFVLQVEHAERIARLYLI